MSRIRLVLTAVFCGLSFFGKSPWEEIDWLFTGRGRTALVLVGLAIGFWPQISTRAREEWLKVRPPSRRRLRRETTELVRDLFEWTAAHPESDRIRRTIESHEQTTRAVQAAEGREAQSRAWTERMYVENAERERELAPVRQRFGGRVRHLVPEYERRGMLARGQEPGRNPSYLEFLLETGMVAELAERLEALSRKL